MKKLSIAEALATKSAVLHELEAVFERLDSSKAYYEREIADNRQYLADYHEANPEAKAESDWSLRNYESTISDYEHRLIALETIRELLSTLI